MVPIERESPRLRWSSFSRRVSQTLLVESWPPGQAATQTATHVPTSNLWYNIKANRWQPQNPPKGDFHVLTFLRFYPPLRSLDPPQWLLDPTVLRRTVNDFRSPADVLHARGQHLVDC